MKIEKIIINSEGDYQIKRDNKLIRCKGVLQTYKSDEDLTEKLNPNIIDILNSDDVIIKEYIEPVITLENVRQNKINELRQKRDDYIEYNGIQIPISDINRYTYLMIGTNEEIQSRLPKKITKDFTLETIEQIKGLSMLLNNHNNNYDDKILECENAKTIADIEKIEI